MKKTRPKKRATSKLKPASKPKRMRVFDVTWQVTARVSIEEKALLFGTSEEFRKSFYDLISPEHVADHIAYNLVRNRARLSMLDGWADREDSDAEVLKESWVPESSDEVVGAKFRSKSRK